MPHDIDLNALIRERAPFQNLKLRVPVDTGVIEVTTKFTQDSNLLTLGEMDSRNALPIIHRMVCDYYGLPTLLNAKRGRAVSYPRQIAMAISATYASTPEVGKYYKRDHSTVLYAMKQVKDNRHIAANAKKLAAKVEAVLSGKGTVQ